MYQLLKEEYKIFYYKTMYYIRRLFLYIILVGLKRGYKKINLFVFYFFLIHIQPGQNLILYYNDNGSKCLNPMNSDKPLTKDEKRKHENVIQIISYILPSIMYRY